MYVIDYKIPSQLKGAVKVVMSSYLRWCKTSISSGKMIKIERAISCILLNVYQQTKGGYSNVAVFPFRESEFSKGVLVNGQKVNRVVSYTATREVLKFMEESQLIVVDKGGRLERGKWGWGYDPATLKWIPKEVEVSYLKLLHGLKVILPEYQPMLLNNVIILRTKLRGVERKLQFKLDEFNRCQYNFQLNYNKFSLGVDIYVGRDKKDVQSYKVFNNDFKNGGRSYMSEYLSIQQLSKEERHQVQIDGKDTAVLDYTAFEVMILYTVLQEVFDGGDPYEIEIAGYDQKLLRKIAKGVLLRLINTESPSSAYRASNNFIREEFDVQKLFDEGLIPEERICVKRIIEELEIKHSQVADHFYRGIGGYLQNNGSLIADYILEYFMQRGVLVVQVHDEFIIDADLVDELESVMKKAFTQVLGFGDNVRIKREK